MSKWAGALVAVVLGLTVVAAVVVMTTRHSLRPFLEALPTGPAVEGALISTPPPASRGPGLGPLHLAFLDARTGFAATTGGGAYARGIGWSQPTARGRIEATRDGGITWHTAWSAPATVFSSIAFADPGDGVASAN